MQKIKIEELACFNEVAIAIGKTNAKRELFKVVSSWIDVCVDSELIEAFTWEDAPQGYIFWNDVYFDSNLYEENPCK